MQNEWTQGFDAGVACLLDEIEKYTEKREYEPRIHTPLMRLIEHLKQEHRETTEKKTCIGA